MGKIWDVWGYRGVFSNVAIFENATTPGESHNNTKHSVRLKAENGMLFCFGLVKKVSQ